jgi:pimeloyl-ACP methyl ester carboxylesterase
MPPRHRSRFVTLACALVLIVAACTPGSDPPEADGATRDTLGTQGLDWQRCAEEVQCARLTVPVDHDRPDGATLALAVARRPATSDQRLGALIVNPGGPGASGVDLVRRGQLSLALDRFDLISWDPRGVGDSHGIDCDELAVPYRELDWTPDDETAAATLDERARIIAQGCRRAAGELADHLGTADTARDLDLLRDALGEDTLTYVGFSYGSAVGLHYLARFPGRIRAMVLDGVADPRDDLRAVLGGQARALERRLATMLGPELVTFDRVLAAAEAGDGPVGPTTVAFAAIATSYRADGGAALTSALRATREGTADALEALADSYWEQASYGPYAGVVCTDQPHPTGARAYDALAGELARDAPRFGEVLANDLRPCAWWPASGSPPDIGTPTAVTVLVLGNLGDVATPHETAVRVADDLHRSVLVTLAGQGHTSIGRSSCVDGHVIAYLETLRTPPDRTRCT